MSARWWLLGPMLGLAAIATSQQAVTPSIEFVTLPDWGTASLLVGQVSGVPISDYRVAVLIFVPDAGWYSKPSCAVQTVPLAPNGLFTLSIGATSIPDRMATMYAAYLIPATYQPVCVTGPAAIPPALEQASLARTLIRR